MYCFYNVKSDDYDQCFCAHIMSQNLYYYLFVWYGVLRPGQHYYGNVEQVSLLNYIFPGQA